MLRQSLRRLAKPRSALNPHVFLQRNRSNFTHFPWVLQRQFSSSPVSSHTSQQTTFTSPTTLKFFDLIKENVRVRTASCVPSFLSNKAALHKVLNNLNNYSDENYLQEHFIDWLSRYAAQATPILKGYFSGKHDLEHLSKDFICFCFENGISLDPKRTLDSFDKHNQLSHGAVKTELERVIPRDTLNVFGFGLDEGQYEKEIVQLLIQNQTAKSVNIYGYDPYALKTPGIQYLTAEQLHSDNVPKFDVIIARWVLHHVEFQHRWGDFIKCINRSNPGATVLIVEHGFLKGEHSLLDKRLYYLFNATFDIVANIGLRPRYFTSTAPNLGANFFIHYLNVKDFEAIKRGVSLRTTQEIYDVGPGFPNQTICRMRISR